MADTEAVALIPCVYRAQGATPQECQALTAQYNLNLSGCCANSRTNACTSPHRACVRCHLEKRTNTKLELATVVDHERGLCARHAVIVLKPKRTQERPTGPRPQRKASPPPDNLMPAEWLSVISRFNRRDNPATLREIVAVVKAMVATLKPLHVGELFGYKGNSAVTWTHIHLTIGRLTEEEWAIIEEARTTRTTTHAIAAQLSDLSPVERLALIKKILKKL